MIISRTPLRMSFVGGGSDLPCFYRRHGGAVISTAVDKYIYVNINRKFDGGIRLAYSKTEEVDSVSKIEHKIVRAALECLSAEGGMEITTIADIPSRGTGLGSSSSFTVGLINAVSAYLGRYVSADDLGRLSCDVEIDRCGEPIGKQDQFAAAYGGLNLIEFKADDSVLVTPIIMPAEARRSLENRIIVFYTGMMRSASHILKAQSEALSTDESKRASLIRMVELTYRLRDEMQAGNLEAFGEILHDNWNLKKTLADGVSTSDIDDWYNLGRSAGALGGKILGAGSGGFLMFYAPEDRHQEIEAKLHFLRKIDFKFDPLGSRIIFYNPTHT
jgi:D-glycero-alpha-D-manno-heptose-7-phosphate kinase